MNKIETYVEQTIREAQGEMPKNQEKGLRFQATKALTVGQLIERLKHEDPQLPVSLLFLKRQRGMAPTEAHTTDALLMTVTSTEECVTLETCNPPDTQKMMDTFWEHLKDEG